MKCHPARWLWGLIPIAMLSWIAVHVEAGRIEQDLEQRARSVLRSSGHDWASIVFSGRDGVLVGTAPREQDQAEALARVRGVWGVRVVEARMRLADEAAGAAPRAGVPPRLPPLAGGSAAREADGTALADARRFDLAPPQPAARAEPHSDPVIAHEPEESSAEVGAADAQKSQEAPPRTSLETAALPQDGDASADACRSAVEQAGKSEQVRFARGKARLDSHSRAMLDRLSEAMADCPHVGLRITGHADADGPARRNLALSKQRAQVIVSYMISKGIDAGRLEAVGYGETRPAAPNDTVENRAKNRRIEVEVTRPIAAAPSATRQGAGNGLPDR
jgi:outer membrane protein OmpA-like peptidoglycan-associated protein